MPCDEVVLTTGRLELRQPVHGDAKAIHALIQHPDTQRFLGPPEEFPGHYVRFQRSAGSWFLSGYGVFIMRERATGKIIGNCGIFHSWRGMGPDMDDCPEAAWIIGAEHVGKGYGREAMEAVLAWFDDTHGPKRVTAIIEPGNDPSFALARRLGFTEFRRDRMDDCEVVLLERLPR